MTEIAELGLKVHSDSVGTAKDRLKGLKDQASATELAVSKLIRTAAGLIGAFASWRAVTSVVDLFVTNTIEAERAQRQLDTVLKSTGNTVGYTTDQLVAMAQALQDVTTFDDEAIQSSQALLLTFKSIGGDVFPKALKSILDVSTAMNTDLNGATIQIGKALNDPIAGLSALSRVGIQFTADQKEMIKGFVETNDIASAQTIILKELESQFGGSAEAARGTLGGALTSLQNAFGDLFEATGPESEKLRQEVEKLVSAISDPQFIAAVHGLGAALFQAFSNALPAIIEIINKVSRFFLEMDARANDPSLKGLKDHGTVEAAAAAAAKKLSEGRPSVPQPGGWGSMEDFFKPFNTPATDPATVSGTGTGVLPGLTDDQIAAGQKIGEQYDKLIEQTNTRIDQLGIEAEAIGMTDIAAQSYRNTQELIQQALQTDIELTPERIDQLTTLAEIFTNAQLTLEGLQLALSNETPWETMGRQVEKLNELLERGKISAGDYSMEIGKSAEKMVSSYASGASDVLGNLEKITEAMGLEGKKAFEVQKALSIARAVVSGAESITHSFNAGAAIGGPPLGFAFAGIAAAATAAQIAAIASTTYQSKSTSAAGTSGGVAGIPQATPGKSVTINLAGNEHTKVNQGSVKTLLETIKEELLVNGQELVIRYSGD